MKLLVPVAAPALGLWTAAVSLTPVRLDQTTALVIALVGATANDQVAVYVAQNQALNPLVTGLTELYAPPQVPAVNGVPLISGPNPIVIQFSASQSPFGTSLYFKRVKGATAGIQIQVAGEDQRSAPGATAWVQGGNAFGATGVLGTTDAQTLNVICNGATILTSDNAGNVFVGKSGAGAWSTGVRCSTTGAVTITGGSIASIDASAATGVVDIGALTNSAINCGPSSNANLRTEWAWASGVFAAPGDAQASQLVLRGVTNGFAPGEAVELKYGSAGDQWFTLQDGHAYAVQVDAVAVSAAGGDAATFSTPLILIQQNGGVITGPAPVGSGIGTAHTAGAAGWTIAVNIGVAGVPGGSPTRISVIFTDTGSTSIVRCVARVRLVEVGQHA
jgi:hypothetical protein